MEYKSKVSEFVKTVLSKFEEKYNCQAYLKTSFLPALAYLSLTMEPCDACPEASIKLKHSFLKRETVANLIADSLNRPETIFIRPCKEEYQSLVEEICNSYKGDLEIIVI